MLYGAAAIASALSPSLTVLFISRFVWGFAAAGPRTLSQAMVRDRYSGEGMARVMTLMQTVFFLAPIAAPLIGKGFLELGLILNFSNIEDYLAKKTFQSQNIEYMCGEVPSILEQIDFNNGFNKVLVYGVFSFFDNKTAKDFFNWASNNRKIKRIFIGNSRDKSLADKFYKRSVSEIELNDFRSSMGAWRTKEYFFNIAKEFKWKLEFSKMPKEYYSHEYYFDVTMSRK